MTVAISTKVTEEVSLQQSQEMIMTIFSCVGYLRDLFPEESFQNHKVAGMNLKAFRKGRDARTDQLLDWIERGCFDALNKKYLKSAILTVLADEAGPNNVLETYNLRVTYPSSSLHQGIDATSTNLAKLSLTRNNQPVLQVDSSGTDFKDAMAKILRNLCVMSQTLKSLPQRKFLNMKLVYYDEVTPAGYEPPGFQAAEFDLDHLFASPSVKYSFGKAGTNHHGLSLAMETCFDSNKSAKTVTGSASALAESVDVKENLAMASQIPQPAQSPPVFPLSQVIEQAAPNNQINKPKTALSSPEIPPKVKCSCGQNMPALEMIQCDTCANWQHTVCVGFISTLDRRLKNREKQTYSCYHCRFGKNYQTFAYLKSLSLFRKSIVVLSADGYTTMAQLARTLEISINVVPKVRDKLVKEGFLVYLPEAKKYEPATSKDLRLKNKIKFYFHQNLAVFPEFVAAQRRDGIKVTAETFKEDSEIGIENLESKPEAKPESKDSKPESKDAKLESKTSTNLNVPYNGNNPLMTKKRQNSQSNATFNEDFMSQTPIINKVATNPPTPKSNSTKKLKMSVPSNPISFS